MLVLADRDGAGKLNIYLDRLEGMDGAIARGRVKKSLIREKIGKEFRLAYDESKKMLAVVSSDKVRVRLLGCCMCVDVTHVHSSYYTFSCSTTRVAVTH